MSVIVASPQTFTCCPASELDGQEESPQDVVDQRIKDLLRVIQERCQIEFTLLVGEFRRPDQMIYGDEGTVWGPEFALMEIWRNACDAGASSMKLTKIVIDKVKGRCTFVMEDDGKGMWAPWTCWKVYKNRRSKKRQYYGGGGEAEGILKRPKKEGSWYKRNSFWKGGSRTELTFGFRPKEGSA